MQLSLAKFRIVIKFGIKAIKLFYKSCGLGCALTYLETKTFPSKQKKKKYTHKKKKKEMKQATVEPTLQISISLTTKGQKKKRKK